MFEIEEQLRTLLRLEFWGNIRLAGGVWVLLLVGRGFSLFQVGVAEAFFHVVSFCCEVPSGMLADVLGRRRTLIASQTMFACSAAAMMLSQSMAGVCLAMALNAMAYNLASGAREAITYDSLLQAGRERDYLRISSLQNTLWRGAQALSTLCAGAAAALGYVRGYGVDLLARWLLEGPAQSAFEEDSLPGRAGSHGCPKGTEQARSSGPAGTPGELRPGGPRLSGRPSPDGGAYAL